MVENVPGIYNVEGIYNIGGGGGGGYAEQKDIFYTLFANFLLEGNDINDNAIIKTVDHRGFVKSGDANVFQDTITYHNADIPAIRCYYDSWSFAIRNATRIDDYKEICCDCVVQVPIITGRQTYLSFFDSIPFLIYFTNSYYDGSKYIGINFLKNVRNEINLHNGAVFTNDAYDRVAFPVDNPENAHHIAMTYRVSNNMCEIYVDGVLYVSTNNDDVLSSFKSIRLIVCSQGADIKISSVRIRQNCTDIMPPW